MKEVRQIYICIFQYRYIALAFICADIFLRISVISMKCSEIKTKLIVHRRLASISGAVAEHA
jgi:hypothetical protein